MMLQQITNKFVYNVYSIILREPCGSPYLVPTGYYLISVNCVLLNNGMAAQYSLSLIKCNSGSMKCKNSTLQNTPVKRALYYI
jgi:hypothetical protein